MFRKIIADPFFNFPLVYWLLCQRHTKDMPSPSLYQKVSIPFINTLEKSMRKTKNSYQKDSSIVASVIISILSLTIIVTNQESMDLNPIVRDVPSGLMSNRIEKQSLFGYEPIKKQILKKCKHLVKNRSRNLRIAFERELNVVSKNFYHKHNQSKSITNTSDVPHNFSNPI